MKLLPFDWHFDSFSVSSVADLLDEYVKLIEITRGTMHEIVDLLRTKNLSIPHLIYEQYGSFCTLHGRRGKNLDHLCELAQSLQRQKRSDCAMRAIEDLSRVRGEFVKLQQQLEWLDGFLKKIPCDEGRLVDFRTVTLYCLFTIIALKVVNFSQRI